MRSEGCLHEIARAAVVILAIVGLMHLLGVV